MQVGGDRKTRDDIAKYGCTVIHVIEEGKYPPFAYSIGITQETGAPEIVVIGLKQPIAHFIVNEYNRRISDGDQLEVGNLYSDFIEGFDVFLDEVPTSAYEDYFGQAIDFYGSRSFKVVQIIYPTTEGIWPWAKDAPESFQVWQPILAKVGQA